MGTGIVTLKFWKQEFNLFTCHILSDSNKLRDEFDHPLNVENWNIQPVGKARLPQKKQMWKTTWNLFITFVTIVKSKMPWNIVRGHLIKLTTFIPIGFSLFLFVLRHINYSSGEVACSCCCFHRQLLIATFLQITINLIQCSFTRILIAGLSV